MNDRDLATAIFKAGIEAVQPDRLIRNCVSVEDDCLQIGDSSLRHGALGNVYVIGAGKASGLMAKAVEDVLGDRITGGRVVVKYGHGCACERVEIFEAGHPYPDEAGVEATRKISELCRHAGEGDLVICLWSGGGSALLADFPVGSSLEELSTFSKALVNSGATINEINCVRKHLSQVKGGQLARLTHPARAISLALSDVVGDPLDVIASGPTVADTSTFAQAKATLERFGLFESAPAAIRGRILAGVAGEIPETPKPGDPLLSRTTNLVIGSNRVALQAGLEFARQHGIEGVIITDRLEGNTEEAAEFIVRSVRALAEKRGKGARFCALFGGETTLKVTGNGLGGRNQHLALAVARLIKGTKDLTILAGGTDGTDGPTDMAGAVVDGTTWSSQNNSGADAEDYLADFDSYHFFQKAGGHVFTGPTMTNVMDMVVAVVNPGDVG